MTVTCADIARGLRVLGVNADDVVLVHSSLKSFGHVDGGAEAVIEALLETVGPTGTVMIPTITGTAEHSPANTPVFDVRNTPCWTGTIPETFRRRPHAVRSLHPTHSVAAIGPQAYFLTHDHLDCATPCGPGSPCLRLTELGGKAAPEDRPTTEGYVRLVKTVYPRVKKIDPDAVFPAGACTGGGTRRGWLKGMAKLGVLQHCDGLSAHTYTFELLDPAERTPEACIEELKRVEGALVPHNNGTQAPLYVTEMGWPTHLCDRVPPLSGVRNRDALP